MDKVLWGGVPICRYLLIVANLGERDLPQTGGGCKALSAQEIGPAAREVLDSLLEFVQLGNQGITGIGRQGQPRTGVLSPKHPKPVEGTASY
jgi:hypothetical protein